MNVRVLLLKSNEEVICDLYENTNDETYTLIKPQKIKSVLSEDGKEISINYFPWSLSAICNKITLPKEWVVCEMEATAEVERDYRKIFFDD